MSSLVVRAIDKYPNATAIYALGFFTTWTARMAIKLDDAPTVVPVWYHVVWNGTVSFFCAAAWPAYLFEAARVNRRQSVAAGFIDPVRL